MLEGQAFGAETDAVFELVFNTSMTGYQEILSDGGNVNVQFVGTSYSNSDVAVSMDVTPTTVQVGKTLTYTIAVTRPGIPLPQDGATTVPAARRRSSTTRAASATSSRT